MIYLLIGCHAQSHKIIFGEDRAGAEAELAKLQERLGQDRWGKNGKEAEPTHTVNCPTGDVVLVVEKVEMARLIDNAKDIELHRPDDDFSFDLQLERTIKYRRALAAEGFGPKNDPVE